MVVAALTLVALRVNPLQALVNNPKLDGALIGVMVQGSKHGDLAYHANLRMMPASNEKLLGASYALDVFGPSHVPTLNFYKVPEGLVIQTDGFPNATYADLQRASDMLRLPKDTKVWVSQAFGPLFPPGWELDDMPNPYANWVTAFTVDRGGFAVWAGDGKFEFRPQSFGSTVDFQPSDEPIDWKFDPFHRKLTVWGKAPTGAMKELDTLAIPYPHLSAASLFGTPVEGKAPAVSGAPTLTLFGPTMAEVLHTELVPSNNYGAEAVLLMAAHKQGWFNASTRSKVVYDRAQAGLTKFLVEKVGIEKGDVTAVDGSGQSRHNYVTPRALVKLLKYGGTRLEALLPKADEGTLGGRLKGLRVQAKTGTLDKVVALSGFVYTNSGRRVVFSVMLNNFACSTRDARASIDQFVGDLAQD